MTRTMLINAQRPEELRLALITDGVLDKYEIAAAESGLTRGNIYRGIVASVQPSLNAAFVDYGAERNGLLKAEDVVASAAHRKVEEGGRPHVERVLEKGRPILVQVTRDAVAGKGAALTSNLSLAGRYLVLMPLDNVRGVSRKVEDEESRREMKEKLEGLALPEGCGVIVRTNAMGQNKTTLNRDLSALLRLWKRIRRESIQGKGPRLLYSDQDLIVQALRDLLDSSVEEVWIDSDDAYEKAERYVQSFMPRAKTQLLRYRERMPLFSRFELEEQIDSIFQRRVGLRAGGSIIIEGTEALTAIDVNSGRSMRGGSQEETAYSTNLEAASEVARQLRLRDIGGLVVVDFIDMRSSKHRQNIEKAVKDAMKADKARSTVGRISPNGLLEINRQRLSKALQLLRRIETRAVTGRLKGVRVELHPELADAIQNGRRGELAELEAEFDLHIDIIAATSMHRSEERIEWLAREKPLAPVSAPAAPSVADFADSGSARSADAAPPAGADSTQGEGEGGAKRSSRRRSRGGRRRRRTGDDATAAEPSPDSPVTAEEPVEPGNHPDTEQPAAPEGHETDAGTDSGDSPTKRRRRRPRRKRSGSTPVDGPNAEPRPEPGEPPSESADAGGDGEDDHRDGAEADEAEPGTDGGDSSAKRRRRRPRRRRR
jgi:ribonuclease E